MKIVKTTFGGLLIFLALILVSSQGQMTQALTAQGPSLIWKAPGVSSICQPVYPALSL
jgi:hypothetical protein